MNVPLFLPRRWRWSSDAATGLLLSARPPLAGASGVLPELRLTVLPGGPDGFAWVDDDLEQVQRAVRDYLLEDEDEYDVGAHRVAYRRFAHRRGAHDLLCERWAWELAGRRFLIDAACSREDYPEFCDVFEQIAESFEPDGWEVSAA